MPTRGPLLRSAVHLPTDDAVPSRQAPCEQPGRLFDPGWPRSRSFGARPRGVLGGPRWKVRSGRARSPPDDRTVHDTSQQLRRTLYELSNNRPITGTITVSGLSSSNDSFAQKTDGKVTSTFDKDYKELVGTGIYYISGGSIIGGDHTFIDFVPANGSASFEVSGLSAPQGIARTDVYIGFSNLSLG
jgi:hypothetical protein